MTSRGGTGFTGLQEEDDGEVYVNLELPQGKLEDFLKQLQSGNSTLKDSFPLAHTASLEALAPPSGRPEDTIIPQPRVAFDPIEKLGRLRGLQERYSVITGQRVKAEQAQRIFDQMPVAGEASVAPPPAPADSIGATFGLGAPATVPPPFPPAGGLPFPYAGVPGVLEPRVKAPPEAPVDVAGGDHWIENEQAVDDARGQGTLPQPDIVFVKDGLDMSFHQLRSHGQRMALDVKEMDRRLQEAEEYAEMKDLKAAPEAMDEYLRRQRILHEQSRKTDELKTDITQEEERQFWIAREQRQKTHRKAYGERFYGAPEEDVPEGYDHTPPQLLLSGHTHVLSLEDMRQKSEALASKSIAMEYCSVPDMQSNFNPMSHYSEAATPSQSFRKNLIQEAAYKGWPAAPSRIPLQQEPEGEESIGEKRRRPRRVQEATPGEGLTVGGSRSSKALPPPSDAPPAEGAPENAFSFFSGWREDGETLFMSGWREREGPPVPNAEEIAAGATSASSTQEVVARGAGRHTNTSGRSDEVQTTAARSTMSDLLMLPFAAFGGWTEAPPAGSAAEAGSSKIASEANKERGSREKGCSTSPSRKQVHFRQENGRDITPSGRQTHNPRLRMAASAQRQSEHESLDNGRSITPPIKPRWKEQGKEQGKGFRKGFGKDSGKGSGKDGLGWTAPMQRQDAPPFCAFAGDAEGEADSPKTQRRSLKKHPRAGRPCEETAPAEMDESVDAPIRERRSELHVRPVGFDSDSEAESDSGWFGFEGFTNPFAELTEDPWSVERKQHRQAHADPRSLIQKLTGTIEEGPVDPAALYMPGACTDRAPPLVPPDHVLIENRGIVAVNEALDEVLLQRQNGKLADRLSAQCVLNYATAVSRSASAVVELGTGSYHVSMLVDLLNFYPAAVQIHLWALEGLVSIYRTEGHSAQESLSGPIFDAVTTLMTTHVTDPSLHEKAPEIKRRILSSLALVLTPATSPRLNAYHVDFAMEVLRAAGIGPSIMEHGLQVLLVARNAHRIRDQAMIARAALRSFKAEPRLVTRALLALGVAFEIAVEAATPESELEEYHLDEEGILLEGTGLARMNPKSADMSGVKKRIWELRNMDEAGSAHKDLVETAKPLAGAQYAQGPGEAEKHMVPVGLRDIVTGMDLYAHDRKVQGAGAVALSSAVMLPTVSYAAMKAEGTIRALILAQQNFSSSRSIALHLCQVMVQFARKDNTLLGIEAAVTALAAGTSFARDPEVAVTALQVFHAFAHRLHEFCPDRTGRLSQIAGDLVRIGEGRHSNPHALAMLLVIFVAAASDGEGTAPGGIAGEQWRQALAGAAAVVVPLRVFYEHVDNVDLVLAAAIAVRILTYGNENSAAHVARLRGVEALLGTIQRHHHRPDMARELLAALANVGAAPSAGQLFSSKLPDAAEAIFNAMERSAETEPDILAQGCRALGSLTAGPKQETSRFAIDQIRIDKCVGKTSAGISHRCGFSEDPSIGGLLEVITGAAGATAQRRRKLRDLCTQLIDCVVASGPQFGRLVGKDGELLAQVQPRRRLAARVPPDPVEHREDKIEEKKMEKTSESAVKPASKGKGKGKSKGKGKPSPNP